MSFRYAVPDESDNLRARAKITLHFGIPSSDHFRQILKSKNIEIVYYYCPFCSLKSTKPNLNLSVKNVKLFLREPLLHFQIRINKHVNVSVHHPVKVPDVHICPVILDHSIWIEDI